MIDNKFAEYPAAAIIIMLDIYYKEEYEEALDELTKLCEDLLHFVYIINLDLKEYLNSQTYDNAERKTS